MDLCNLSNIKSLMAEAGITFRKEFGQNFLTNRMIPEDIADSCADSSETMILEIGPGIGCLTQELAIRYRRVVAVEIDRVLIPILSKTMAEYDNVTIINDDIMKVDLEALVNEYSNGLPIAVCANLPYYITTPILMRLIESGIKFSSITVMVQNEVANRLVAKPGTADYGSITAEIGFYGTAEKLFKVSRGCFTPVPKVDSAVVRINLFPKPHYNVKNERLFHELIRAAFDMRRKTLQNAISAKLTQYSKDEILNAIRAIGHDDKVRGERLSTEDFINLANVLNDIH